MSKGSVDDGVVFHAGFPNAAEDERFGSLSLDALIVRHRASTFFWRLENDAEVFGWPKGSILVVDRALEPKEGSMAVLIDDDAFLLCRFMRSGFRRLDGAKVDGTLWGVVTYCLQPLQGSLQGASLQQGGTLQNESQVMDRRTQD